MTQEEKAAWILTDAVNGPATVGPVAEQIGRQHRTLQQNFTRQCFAWIRYLAATDASQQDLRNEASVKACKEIIKLVDPDDLILPYI